MTEKSPKDIENFAFEFGKHCQEFNKHEYYKKFIEELLKDLTKDFSREQYQELQQYVEKIVAARAREEKNGETNSAFSNKNGPSENENNSESGPDADMDFM
ncbi:hypothetical protein TVAG_484620 [Trichomonas vaginalis G3]|uniref:Uncharacterized protein n=1 Tax=Trichomonas vaginalis (strain ATCC PRA-98 / G3) TaxID=412133 RepID=A2F1Z0_TRIV3|nr:eukaryotic translation initiation factor 3 like domains domain-containing protein [Trichomonas vaginalis G3]EAY01088.1 hypothetical protein TVAG_484620 [Trichomonas vaginalis G3]KAI5545911.1 eukaryotic translation initiation factor 3 like domains domain-containing protein [Trichomonas vaginalis G3]|eukprot:XP_001330104.1 hypothetical protein [Trichomonas vaginalis G3]